MNLSPVVRSPALAVLVICFACGGSSDPTVDDPGDTASDSDGNGNGNTNDSDNDNDNDNDNDDSGNSNDNNGPGGDSDAQVVFTAPIDTDAFELWVVDVATAMRRKLSGPIVEGRSVLGFVWSPDRARVAYRADADTDGVIEVYIVEVVTGNVQKVNGPMVGEGPTSDGAWSHDGRFFAYSATQDSLTVNEAYVVDAETGIRMKVSPSTQLGAFGLEAWSPTENVLAYVGSDGSTLSTNVYTFKPGDDGPVQVSNATGNDDAGGPVWSPDGKRLAYSFDDRPSFGDSVRVGFVYDLETQTSVLIPEDFNDRPNSEIAPLLDWSPDSQSLAYTIEGPAGVELWTVDVDTKARRAVSNPSAEPGTSLGWAWTPNAPRLVYRSNFTSPPANRLYAVDVDGSAHVQLSPAAFFGDSTEALAFRPSDGRLMYFAEVFANNVLEPVLVNPDGSESVALSMPPDGFRASGRPQWSPDGQRILFSAREGSLTGGWTTDAAGSEVVQIVGATFNGRYTTDGQWIVSPANNGLRAAPADGSATAIDITGPLQPGGDIVRWAVSGQGT